MHHYGMAVGETVVQVHGAAPFQINYVNPSDDPSMKKYLGPRTSDFGPRTSDLKSPVPAGVEAEV